MTVSSFATALALFIALNASIIVFCGDNTLSMYLPGQSSAFIEQYKSATNAPDVVLLGSSVVRVSFHNADRANFPNEHEGYYKALTLRQYLSQSKPVSVFNASEAGLMVTDTLLIESKLLNSKIKPKLIVYAVSPRDFVDSLLWSESSTDIFRTLFGFYDALRYRQLFTASKEEQLELLFKASLPLYSARQELQQQLEKPFHGGAPAVSDENKLRAEANKAAEKRNETRLKYVMQHAPHTFDYLKSAQKVHVRTRATIAAAAGQSKEFIASLWEYSMRYFLIDQNRYDRQYQAFCNIVKLAKEHGIPVIVVNAPLAPENIALLPESFQQQFVKKLQAACTEYGADFIDLQLESGSTFTREGYQDTVHLNHTGGTTLAKRLAPVILKKLNY